MGFKTHNTRDNTKLLHYKNIYKKNRAQNKDKEPGLYKKKYSRKNEKNNSYILSATKL